MKIKLNDLLLISFLILISFILKEVQFIPIAIAALLILFGSKIDPGLKNLIYVVTATIPFVPFFIFFVFYLPFVIFGSVLENASFIKKYVLGFAVAHLLRLVVYYPSALGLPINEYSIIFVLLIFLSMAYYVFIKKKGVDSLKNLFSVKNQDYKILLITLFFLFFVGHVIYNDTSLHLSNATQIYAKQNFVIEIIDKFGFFPQYDPGTGMGEQLFLTDSQTHFTKNALILATIFLKPLFGPLLVYNAHSMFILWMIILASSLILKELLSADEENSSRYVTYFIILGSLAIGLSFQFVRILESLKAFSAHPINLLLIAMILAKPKKPAEFFIMAYLMLFSYMVHVIQAIGVFVFALSLLIIVYFRDHEAIKSGFRYLMNNKLKVLIVILVFIGVMFAYTANGVLYKDYVREHAPGIFAYENFFQNYYNYIKSYFVQDGVSPFSIKYPDLGRLDTKESGFFLSVIGGISFLYLLLNFKNKRLSKARIFAISFVFQFLLYTFIIHIFNLGNLEPGYRIIHPYTVLLLSVSIAAAFSSFRIKIIKTALLIIFSAFLLHSLFFVRTNLDNIHGEQIISGGSLKSEMDFVRNLPNDGRFITYGLFANAVDAGMSHNTGHYFTRYQYNLWNEKNNIYELIHTTHSFGDFPGLNDFSGLELKNYFNLGGYRYLFLNTCHPTGNVVANKMFPNYTLGLYQNQCLAFLMVNDTNYAEKVTLLKNFDDSVLKTEEGNRHYSLSRLERFKLDTDNILKDAKTSNPIKPEKLEFERINPQEVIIHGDFKDNEWVVFKEEYFPRWKAYINNIEVPVYPTNFNMILIKAVKGTSIVLKYDILLIEKITSLISLIAVLICSSFFILLLKQE